MATPAARTVPLTEAQEWLRRKTAPAPKGTPPLSIEVYGRVVGPTFTNPGHDMVAATVAAPDGSEHEYYFWHSGISGRVLGRYERTLRAPRETPSV